MENLRGHKRNFGNEIVINTNQKEEMADKNVKQLKLRRSIPLPPPKAKKNSNIENISENRNSNILKTENVVAVNAKTKFKEKRSSVQLRIQEWENLKKEKLLEKNNDSSLPKPSSNSKKIEKRLSQIFHNEDNKDMNNTNENIENNENNVDKNRNNENLSRHASSDKEENDENHHNHRNNSRKSNNVDDKNIANKDDNESMIQEIKTFDTVHDIQKCVRSSVPQDRIRNINDYERTPLENIFFNNVEEDSPWTLNLGNEEENKEENVKENDEEIENEKEEVNENGGTEKENGGIEGKEGKERRGRGGRGRRKISNLDNVILNYEIFDTVDLEVNSNLNEKKLNEKKLNQNNLNRLEKVKRKFLDGSERVITNPSPSTYNIITIHSPVTEEKKNDKNIENEHDNNHNNDKNKQERDDYDDDNDGSDGNEEKKLMVNDNEVTVSKKLEIKSRKSKVKEKLIKGSNRFISKPSPSTYNVSIHSPFVDEEKENRYNNENINNGNDNKNGMNEDNNDIQMQSDKGNSKHYLKIKSRKSKVKEKLMKGSNRFISKPSPSTYNVSIHSPFIVEEKENSNNSENNNENYNENNKNLKNNFKGKSRKSLAAKKYLKGSKRFINKPSPSTYNINIHSPLIDEENENNDYDDNNNNENILESKSRKALVKEKYLKGSERFLAHHTPSPYSLKWLSTPSSTFSLSSKNSPKSIQNELNSNSNNNKNSQNSINDDIGTHFSMINNKNNGLNNNNVDNDYDNVKMNANKENDMLNLSNDGMKMDDMDEIIKRIEEGKRLSAISLNCSMEKNSFKKRETSSEKNKKSISSENFLENFSENKKISNAFSENFSKNKKNSKTFSENFSEIISENSATMKIRSNSKSIQNNRNIQIEHFHDDDVGDGNDVDDGVDDDSVGDDVNTKNDDVQFEIDDELDDRMDDQNKDEKTDEKTDELTDEMTHEMTHEKNIHVDQMNAMNDANEFNHEKKNEKNDYDDYGDDVMKDGNVEMDDIDANDVNDDAIMKDINVTNEDEENNDKNNEENYNTNDDDDAIIEGSNVEKEENDDKSNDENNNKVNDDAVMKDSNVEKEKNQVNDGNIIHKDDLHGINNTINIINTLSSSSLSVSLSSTSLHDSLFSIQNEKTTQHSNLNAIDHNEDLTCYVFNQHKHTNDEDDDENNNDNDNNGKYMSPFCTFDSPFHSSFKKKASISSNQMLSNENENENKSEKENKKENENKNEKENLDSNSFIQISENKGSSKIEEGRNQIQENFRTQEDPYGEKMEQNSKNDSKKYSKNNLNDSSDSKSDPIKYSKNDSKISIVDKKNGKIPKSCEKNPSFFSSSHYFQNLSPFSKEVDEKNKSINKMKKDKYRNNSSFSSPSSFSSHLSFFSPDRKFHSGRKKSFCSPGKIMDEFYKNFPEFQNYEIKFDGDASTSHYSLISLIKSEEEEEKEKEEEEEKEKFVKEKGIEREDIDKEKEKEVENEEKEIENEKKENDEGKEKDVEMEEEEHGVEDYDNDDALQNQYEEMKQKKEDIDSMQNGFDGLMEEKGKEKMISESKHVEIMQKEEKSMQESVTAIIMQKEEKSMQENDFTEMKQNPNWDDYKNDDKVNDDLNIEEVKNDDNDKRNDDMDKEEEKNESIVENGNNDDDDDDAGGKVNDDVNGVENNAEMDEKDVDDNGGKKIAETMMVGANDDLGRSVEPVRDGVAENNKTVHVVNAADELVERESEKDKHEEMCVEMMNDTMKNDTMKNDTTNDNDTMNDIMNDTMKNDTTKDNDTMNGNDTMNVNMNDVRNVAEKGDEEEEEDVGKMEKKWDEKESMQATMNANEKVEKRIDENENMETKVDENENTGREEKDDDFRNEFIPHDINNENDNDNNSNGSNINNINNDNFYDHHETNNENNDDNSANYDFNNDSYFKKKTQYSSIISRSKRKKNLREIQNEKNKIRRINSEKISKNEDKNIYENASKNILDFGLKYTEEGVRRSTRIKMRPLEYWRNEDFEYRRVYNELPTIHRVFFLQSDPTWPRPDPRKKSFDGSFEPRCLPEAPQNPLVDVKRQNFTTPAPQPNDSKWVSCLMTRGKYATQI